MAGKIIADIIEAPVDRISLNVGNLTVLSANSSGLTYVPTGNVNVNIGSTANLTLGNVTVSNTSTLGNISVSRDATFAANVNIDSGTLFVNSQNNRVGINTQSPLDSFHLGSGNFRLGTSTDFHYFTGSGNLYRTYGGAEGSGLHLTGNGFFGINYQGTFTDNTITIGIPQYRFSVVYAGTGTINTSDENEKQNIENLSDAEKRVAVKVKALIKKFKWKSSVAEKGDSARTHIGVIAQEVKSAFESEGLDAAQYGLFCLDDWYEVNGSIFDENEQKYTENAPGAIKKQRLGIRYDQLLAFVISAI